MLRMLFVLYFRKMSSMVNVRWDIISRMVWFVVMYPRMSGKHVNTRSAELPPHHFADSSNFPPAHCTVRIPFKYIYIY